MSIHTVEEFHCGHCGFITRRITEGIRAGRCPACGRGGSAEPAFWTPASAEKPKKYRIKVIEVEEVPA